MKYLVMVMVMLTGCDSGSSDDPGASDTGPGGMDPDMMAVEEAPPVGAAFFVDSESGEWLQPLGAERFLALAPAGLSLWLTVDAVAAGSLDFMLAVGGAEAQDRCIRTILMEPVELLPERGFRYGPAAFALPNGIRADGLVVEGRFTEDLSGVAELGARGRIDLSSIPPDILPALDGVEPCNVASSLLGVDCVDCDDGRPICLEVELQGFVGTPKPAGGVVGVDLADCHPDCAASEENVECDTSGFPR